MEPDAVWGERRLLWEILDEARRCVHGQVVGATGGFDRQREIRTAKAWFANDEDWGVMSFANVCYVLRLDLSSVRRWARKASGHVVVLGLRNRQRQLRPKRERACA